MIGSIVNFDKKKGFGYIRADNGRSVFLHARQWKAGGLKGWPQCDEWVSFEVAPSDRGLRAINISRVDPPCP